MSTVTTDTPPEAAAFQLFAQLATGYIASAALQTVLKLEIPDRLASGPRSAADLAAETGTNEDALYRVMRALASLGVFEEQSPRVFAANLPAMMLRKGPGTMYDMGLWITSPFHFRTYAEMLYSVKTGQPGAEKVAGMPVFEYFPKNPELSEIFNNAMTSFSVGVVNAALKVYDFSGIGTLVDIAGGHGQVLTTILQANPSMRGVLFDLPHVIAGCRSLLQASGVADRVRTESGDFFTAVPAGGDAYVMKHIIHDWDDERAIAILTAIRGALAGKPDGRVILFEAILQPGNTPDFGKLLDLEMLMMPGGKERTEAEYGALFAAAGFDVTRIIPTESPLSVIEARTR